MNRPLRIAALGLVVLFASLLGGAPSAHAEDFDVSIFYEELSPHGQWLYVEPYGWGWTPYEVDFDWRPYLHGRWMWINEWGWTWISEEPWAWAAYHYGRWHWTDDWGWVWFPGTVWAPAWVEFRWGGGWIGWAPLPPGPRWRLDMGPIDFQPTYAFYSWTFVPVRFFAETDVLRYAARSVHVPTLTRIAARTVRPVARQERVVLTDIQPAEVERVAGKPIPRRTIEEAAKPAEAGTAGVKVEGEKVRIFRPRLAPTKPAAEPKRTRPPVKDVGEWLRRRKEAMERHLDGETKAVETEPEEVAPGEVPPGGKPEGKPPGPPPGPPEGRPPSGPPGGRPGMSPEEIQKRREEAKRVLEEERKRLKELFERRRRQLEEGQTPPGQDKKGDDKDEKDDDEDEDKDKDKDKDKEKKEKD